MTFVKCRSFIFHFYLSSRIFGTEMGTVIAQWENVPSSEPMKARIKPLSRTVAWFGIVRPKGITGAGAWEIISVSVPLQLIPVSGWRPENGLHLGAGLGNMVRFSPASGDGLLLRITCIFLLSRMEWLPSGNDAQMVIYLKSSCILCSIYKLGQVSSQNTVKEVI